MLVCVTANEMHFSCVSLAGRIFSLEGENRMKHMKRTLAILLTLVLLCTGVPFAFAEDVTIVDSGYCGGEGDGTNLIWRLDSEGTLTISGEGKMTDYSFISGSGIKRVIIENGVTTIGTVSFRYLDELEQVSIPDSVISIGNQAFELCTKLSSIIIPDSVRKISAHAFAGTDLLNDESNWSDDVLYIGNHLISAKNTLSGNYVVKPGTKTIASDAFQFCTLLEGITIPDSVISIGDAAFWNCSRLTNVTIPDSVTSIGEGPFMRCETLDMISVDSNNTKYMSDENGCLFDIDKKTLIQYPTGRREALFVIPDSVERIGASAFSHCRSLTNVTIPDNVTSIGASAFSDCTSLVNITIGPNVENIGSGAFSGTALYRVEENWDDGVLYIGNYLIKAKGGAWDAVTDVSVVDVDIKDGTKCVADAAFYGCKDLVSVTIPNSVTNIGMNVFSRCDLLKRITIPDSVESIGYGTFSYCSSLTDVVLSDNLTSIAEYAFISSESLKTVNLPNSLKHIGRSAFFGCRALENVTIPNGVLSIGEDAFELCSAFTKVTIPDSVTCIGGEAFSGCFYLTSVVIGNGVTSLRGFSFTGNSCLQSIKIGNNVACIENNAFSGCSNLTEVALGNGLKSIGDGSFSRCSALSSVMIPDSVAYIGASAFYDCTSLEDVVIGNGVTKIESYTFNNCCNATIHIGTSVQTIEQDAFTRTHLIIVDESNPYFSSVEGVLFNKDQSQLIWYPDSSTRTEYIVPESVTKVCRGAFYNNMALKKLVFQEGLCEIEEEAIQYCSILMEVSLPVSLNKMDVSNFTMEVPIPAVYTIKSMNAEYGEDVFVSYFRFKSSVPTNIQKEIILSALGLSEPSEEVQQYLENIENYIEISDPENGKWFYAGTIRCHAGSTAEAYAIEHGMDYELTHFFEGEWTYDWDNLVRWRKCIHCDERETEPLETENPGGAEIVGPADGDTSFDVEPVSTDYVLIQEALGEQNVVKAFDISLKNQDGVHVQPKGTVKVKLPGDFKAGDYKVYRVNADGTYTDMNAFLEGSHLVFYTDHFSLYVVVDESAPAEPDTPETPDTPAKESKVRFILRTVFEFLQKLIRIVFGK